MEGKKPIACRDCRFHYSDSIRCWNPEALSYDSIGDEQRESLRDMRDWDGKCGREAKLFEAPIPTPTKVILRRWAIAACILVITVAAFHYF